jgi:hypothetical protein
MSLWGELLIGLVILVGLLGIVIPVLPGLSLVVAAVLVWAIFEADLLAWSVFGVVFGLGAAATIIKFVIPGRRLKESGVPTATLVIAVVCAIIGFFLIPIVGAPIGFVAGIYFIEWSRTGHEQAWPATRKSVVAVALSIGIELSAGLLVGGIWLVAAVFG